MAAWFGEKTHFFGFYSFSGVFLGISVLSLAEILYWVLRAFTGSAFMDLFCSQVQVPLTLKNCRKCIESKNKVQDSKGIET